MKRVAFLAACAVLGATGCTTVRLTPATFRLSDADAGCPVIFYRLPPRVPYRELGAADIVTMTRDPRVAEEAAARQACELHANAVVVTMETVGGRTGVVFNGVFIRTEAAAPAGAPVPTPGGDNSL